jgi:hypothetical protein
MHEHRDEVISLTKKASRNFRGQYKNEGSADLPSAETLLAQKEDSVY